MGEGASSLGMMPVVSYSDFKSLKALWESYVAGVVMVSSKKQEGAYI